MTQSPALTPPPVSRPASAVFIGGTDTGVGKTIVTATLARCLVARGVSVGVMKPFLTGTSQFSASPVSDDAEVLRIASATPLPLGSICPWRFRDPLAPLVAARREHRQISWARSIEAIQSVARVHALTLIEGVGGIAVPITRNRLIGHLPSELGIPALVVGRSALGTINHTFLTIQHLRDHGVEVLGFILVRTEAGPLRTVEKTSAETLVDLAQSRFFGFFPYSAEIAHARTPSTLCTHLPHRAPLIREVAALLTQRYGLASRPD